MDISLIRKALLERFFKLNHSTLAISELEPQHIRSEMILRKLYRVKRLAFFYAFADILLISLTYVRYRYTGIFSAGYFRLPENKLLFIAAALLTARFIHQLIFIQRLQEQKFLAELIEDIS